MDNDEPIPRKRKIDNESDDDLISDLPLKIIHSILTLLPIRDAVRTCILSSQWRYKWCSLPNLVFDLGCVHPLILGRFQTLVYDLTCVDQTKSIRLNRMVTHALFHHQGPIHRFKLSALNLISCPETDSWLLALSRNGIRELFLTPFYYHIGNHGEILVKRSYAGVVDRWFRVHSSLYSCRNLTHLELSNCELPPPPPTFKGFPCLRSLVLGRVRAPCALVESLVNNSPLLENLTCHSVDLEFRIRAPNLKCLELHGRLKEITVDAPLLANLLVPSFDFTPEQQQSSVCNYAKFLGGFTNLERLQVPPHSLKYLSFGIESYDHSLVFHRLKSIEVRDLSFDEKKQVASVVGLLIMAAPNLQEFKFSIARPPNASEAPPIDLSYSDFRWAPDFTINKLKVIEVFDVFGLPSAHDMEFIKLLLSSSTVLETMTVDCFPPFDPDGILNLATELLSYCRASPNAKVLLRQWRGQA